MLIPQAPLIVAGAFAGVPDPERAAGAIARGLRAGGCDHAELCPLARADDAGEVRELLDAAGFDARMRSARAVIIGCDRLALRTLTGSFAFEVATRARQGGVPAYAVVGESALGEFEARMLDLQAILEADGARGLAAAGRRLAALM